MGLVPLGELSTHIAPGLTLSRAQGRPSERLRLFQVLQVRDLTEQGGVAPAATFQKVELPESAMRYAAQDGDVVLTCRGSQLKVAKVEGDAVGTLVTSNLMQVRLKPLLRPEVLLAHLHSPAGQAALRERVRSTHMLLSLTRSDLLEMLVPVPNAKQQAHIAELWTATHESYAASLRAAELRYALGRALTFNMLSLSTTR
ncbi:hypothetical protein ACN28E_45860 [Archangium lansingense]|uniref:hypothetical protein n=1 Tax=Archangium lansingense TaxID=2995310 RepID=UPI003B7EAB57